jgi:hypothetical protein
MMTLTSSETPTPVVTRADLFLDLARRLTEAFPEWLIQKNLDSALEGSGDLDSVAPPRDWDAIEDVFRAWARDHDLWTSIVCRHIPNGPYFITLQPGGRDLLVLDVKRRRNFRAAHLFDWADLQPMATIDGQGLRILRPGAQGVLKFVWNGVARGGRRNESGLQVKHVRDLLESDPEGVRGALDLFGAGRSDLRRAIDAYLAGGWDRRALVRLELRFLARALRNPRLLWSRLWVNVVEFRRCPVLVVTRQSRRRVSGNIDAWLDRVALSHEVSRGPASDDRSDHDGGV